MSSHQGLICRSVPSRHLWMHFTRLGAFADREVPVIARGEGCYVWDQHGKRYLDGLSGLFTVQVGHGRAELGRGGGAAGRDARLLPGLVVRPRTGDRAGHPPRRVGTRRPQPGLPHPVGRRRRRDRDQAVAAVLQADAASRRAPR